ncbi:18571_t:CDS:2 [Acaulospora morrowiae]|uniref:18571_t:CDS:1 n=1 Tax=Acaulospora morrowiae TaxID=94023 RepID=A0A9N8VW47_9GLOM|nr:18571_t:CDS:2 [Acaulospora morrowiae]
MLRSLRVITTTLTSKQQFRYYTASSIPGDVPQNNATEQNLTHEEIDSPKEDLTPEKSPSENTQENSSPEPTTPKMSFAERAKAGFPKQPSETTKVGLGFSKRAQPSELAKNWAKPPEKLQMFVPPVDLGPIGIASKFVEIRNLPLTAIPRDIQMMSADIPIAEIAPIRNGYLQLTGSYELKFQSEKDALKFVESNLQKYLGGNKLEFKFLAHSGNSIIVCGLPRNISPDQIRELITDSPGNQSSVWRNIFELPIAGSSTIHSKYLIVLKGKNESYRLVRKLHNSYYAKDINGKKFHLKVKVAY